MEKIDFSKIYSFSKLGRFEKCPLDYYFFYLDPKWKGYQKPRDYKTKGIAVHGALTLFYHLPVQERNFQSLKDCLGQAWFSEIDLTKKPPLGKIGGFNTIGDERRAYLESLKMLKNFFDLKEINPSLFYIPTRDIRDSFEDYESMIQPVDSDDFISGKFDRIDKLEDGTLRIVDFKTGKKNQNRFQLDFYRVLAELNFKIPVSVVSFYYLAKGEIVDFSVSNINLQEIKEKIFKKLKKIKSTKEFSPKPSRLCHYCDFKEICEQAP